MNSIEKQRIAFKSLLALKTDQEKIEQDAMMLAAQFFHDISDIMASRNMRLKDLAEQIGVSKSYITQLFRGDKLPNFKFMAKVQIVLGVNFQLSTKLNKSGVAILKQKNFESV